MEKVKAAVVIPARFASTRLPGKPLLSQTGKPLIQHTSEWALRAKSSPAVYVATDDRKIFDAVTDFGGNAVMTSASHETGSARVAEVAESLDAEIIVNLQGDEPEIDPAHIDFLIEMVERFDCFVATLACPFSGNAKVGAGSPKDPSAVKAILGKQLVAKELSSKVFQARYFTRVLAAYPLEIDGAVVSPEQYYLHIGVYGFRRENLMRFASAPIASIEKSERLEQLRILEMGEAIAVGLVAEAPPGVDTPEDYEAFVRRNAVKIS